MAWLPSQIGIKGIALLCSMPNIKNLPTFFYNISIIIIFGRISYVRPCTL